MDKTIGIVGGVGPKATVDLFRKIVDLTPASIDQDHPRILIYDNPKIPNRKNAIMGNGESPRPYVVESAQKLQRMGADFLAIASNLTHYYFDDVQQAVEVPVLHLIKIVVERVFHKVGTQNVGLLAPTPTVHTEMYQRELRQRGLTPLLLNEQQNKQLVDKSIYGSGGIKSGDIENSKQMLQRALRMLSNKGADVIILGCTELPLVLGKTGPDNDCLLIDTNKVFAKRIVEESN